MAQFSQTWWGQRFIEALETFTESNRLGRGRSYARNGKIKSYQIKDGKITAQVRGSVNPYFGVYKEPLYNTTIEIKTISRSDWSKVIATIASKASWVSKLLMNEVPDNIESAFQPLKLHLLPHNRKDFKTSCSCPDHSNPCKHIAGVYYLIAAQLDQDPFLLFELRGITREALQLELEKSPLGRALGESLKSQPLSAQPVESYYTQPQPIPLPQVNSLQDYWLGTKPLPQTIEPSSEPSIAAILVKKGGDYPAFWGRDNSFLEVMEEFYERVRTKNKDLG
ncbi:SWIM zinc finger family protein [Crocosphaera sp. Alani8]|uniref:SWIM zinc finger family protein n=1 Tax=Crocosphaera sp. Alani8 TaxID=3038952 RepID=UPI00313B2AFC